MSINNRVLKMKLAREIKENHKLENIDKIIHKNIYIYSEKSIKEENKN